MKKNNLIENFRGFRGGFRGRIGNYVNNATYTYKKDYIGGNPNTYSLRLKSDMELLSKLKSNEEFLQKIYAEANNDKKPIIKNIIETSQFKKDINKFIEDYNQFKNSNINTEKIELTDQEEKEFLLKYYPLFKSNNVDTNTFSNFKKRLESKFNLNSSYYLENYIDIFFKVNNDLLLTDRSIFYVRIVNDSKYKIDFENKLKYVEIFKTKVNQLNLNDPVLPNTLKYNFEEKESFTKKNLKFFETFMISYLALFNIYVNGYFNKVIIDNDPEVLPSPSPGIENFSNDSLSDDLNNFGDLIIITDQKKNLLKDILNFTKRNIYTKTQIQIFENILYDRLKKLKDDNFDELIHELNFPDNLFEATDDQIVILSEINNYDYERRLDELETLLLMREFYIKLDNVDKQKFFKLSNSTKMKVIINWINKKELDNDIVEEENIIHYNINYIKNTYNDVKKDLDKKFSTINKKYVIVFLILIIILIGMYFYFNSNSKNNDFSFDDF